MPRPCLPMSLSFGLPVWLLVLSVVVAAALTAWTYVRTTPPLPVGRRLLLGGLRFLALTIILFLLFEPIWRRISETSEPPLIALLVDESKSLRVTSGPDSTDPGSTVRTALTPLRSGGMDGPMRIFGFGDRTRRISGPLPTAFDSLRFDSPRTDIATALRSASEQLQGENLRAIVLASDGQYNTGRNPLYWAERSPVPIHTVVIGDTTRQRDVQIRRAVTNDLAYIGSELPVRAHVQANGYAGEQVQVTLLDGSEQLDAQRMRLSGSASEIPVDLSFVPESAGLKRLTVTASRLPGETTYRNNTQALTVRVLESKRQVLLLGAAPTPDLAATRQILEEDPAAEVTTRVPKAPGTFYGGALPEDLSPFDVMVLAGFPGQAVAPKAARRVAEAAREDVPPLFLMSDQTDLGSLNEHFAEVLPAAPEKIRSSFVEAAFVPTDRGRRHPVFDLPEPADPELWKRLPPLQANQSRWQASPDARVLATSEVRGVATGDPLLLVRQRAGRRSAMLLGTGTWRWANVPEGLEAAAPLWPGLLSNLLQWVSIRKDDRPVRVRPAQTTFAGNEPVTFTGQVYNESLDPVPDASMQITLTGPEGKQYPYQMTSVGNGRYTLDAGALPEGTYSYTAAAEKEERTLGTDQGSFAVGSLTLEFRETRADPALMRQIAQRSGGRFVTAADADALPAQVTSASSFAPLITRSRQETRLWQRYGFLIAALLLLGTEWVLRKRSGMA